MCGGTGVSFLSFSNRYSVCVCRSLLWVLFVVVCLSQALRISSTMAISAAKLALGREQIALQAVCSSLQTSNLCWGYTQSVCCLLESRVSSRGSWLPALWGICHCVCSLSEAFLRKEPSPAFLAVQALFTSIPCGASIVHKHCLHKHVMNERTEFALSAHREEWGWLCSSPPYELAVPVPLLLRHDGDFDRGDRTWIWWTGWRRSRPISTCIPQI